MAEGEAGEEVDMETTKGVIKENTKGTTKKIIKVLICHKRKLFLFLNLGILWHSSVSEKLISILSIV